MTLMQSEGLIEVADQQEMLAVLGRNDELLRVIQDCYDAMPKLWRAATPLPLAAMKTRLNSWRACLRSCCFWSVRVRR